MQCQNGGDERNVKPVEAVSHALRDLDDDNGCLIRKNLLLGGDATNDVQLAQLCKDQKLEESGRTTCRTVQKHESHVSGGVENAKPSAKREEREKELVK